MRTALGAALAALALIAAAPSPSPLPAPTGIDLTKLQPKAHLPKVPLHAEYVVAVNKKGQVTRVLSGKPSPDATYNVQTYGNALQAFIRTTDGGAISGRYRLTYDYDPQTAHVRRQVALVAAGGVDPNAPGAVDQMLADVRKHAAQHSAPPATPTP